MGGLRDDGNVCGNDRIQRVQIVEAVLEYIEDLKAQGKNITAPTDKYVTIK